MTDKEKLINLFNEFGIKYDEKIIDGQEAHDYETYKNATEKAKTQIEIENGIGYYDFNCDFYFDENGKFLGHGVWE